MTLSRVQHHRFFVRVTTVSVLSASSPLCQCCQPRHHCVSVVSLVITVSVVSLVTTVSVLSASSPLVVVYGHCHQFVQVSNWTLTPCQSQMVASGQSNSYISKCTPPNSIHNIYVNPFSSQIHTISPFESNPQNQSMHKNTKMNLAHTNTKHNCPRSQSLQHRPSNQSNYIHASIHPCR